MIKYSEEFKKEIKELFPDNKLLIKLVEEGDYDVYKHLGGYYSVIPCDEILKAKTLEEIQDIASIAKRKAFLYKDWELEIIDDNVRNDSCGFSGRNLENFVNAFENIKTGNSNGNN